MTAHDDALPALPIGEAEVLWHEPDPVMPECPGKIIDASHAFMDAAPLGTRLYSAEQMRAYALAARAGEPKRTFDCSWPHCGCDRTGVDSPPCRAEHANERAAAPAAREGEPVYGIFDPDYARVFTKARCIAWSEGYALAVHGSFTRDLDLLAVPWADHACDAEHLVDRIADACGLKPNGHPPGDKPHGRRAWTLLFPAFGDPRFIDLSVFAAPPALPPEAREAMRMAADALRLARPIMDDEAEVNAAIDALRPWVGEGE